MNTTTQQKEEKRVLSFWKKKWWPTKLDNAWIKVFSPLFAFVSIQIRNLLLLHSFLFTCKPRILLVAIYRKGDIWRFVVQTIASLHDVNNPRLLFVEDLREFLLTFRFQLLLLSHQWEVVKCYSTIWAQIASHQAWAVDLACFFFLAQSPRLTMKCFFLFWVLPFQQICFIYNIRNFPVDREMLP